MQQVPDDEVDPPGAARQLIREVRQRLESLQRAGVKGLPHVDAAVLAVPRPPAAEPARMAPAVEARTTSAPAPRTAIAPKPAAPSAPSAEPPPPASPRAAPESRPAAAAGGLGSLFDEPGFSSPPVPAAERAAILEVLAQDVASCVKCQQLARTRTRTVFADGSPTARLMFIGEAPGADEDRTGVPFVGRAGQLLTDMITKGMRLRREDVYIANILKCRPPENRDPTLEESANCLPYLERQIEVVRPEFLCLLGRTAVQGILGTSLSMSRMRGKWYRHRGIPTVVTYHPSYLLRNPAAKKDAWEDLQILMNAMGLAIPGKGKAKG